MRLSAHEIAAIKTSVHTFDPQAQVYLFGSRVNDELRGGDIDLLIVSKTMTRDQRRLLKLKLYDQIGEQKIDIVLAKDTSEPFTRIAIDEGILL